MQSALVTGISAISAVISGYYFRRTIMAVYGMPRLTAMASPESREFVTLLIPVRNEANKILREHLDSINSQTHARCRIVAVDDNSTDGSGAILGEYVEPGRFTVVKGAGLTEGWCGKTHALRQARGLLSTDCEWILMLDADVVLHPNAIAYALNCAQARGLDALCVLPRIRMVTFWENVVAPVVSWLALMRVTPTEANDPSKRQCFGYGNFMLVRRGAHDAIGGFEAYKGDVLDDSALMELLKHRGFRTMVVNGDDLLEARICQNLGQMVASAAKCSFRAISFSVWRLLEVTAKELIGVFWPLLSAPLLWSCGSFVLAAGIVSALFTFMGMMIVGRAMHARWFFLVFYPIGHGVAVWIVTYSALAALFSRRIWWKGRPVRLS